MTIKPNKQALEMFDTPWLRNHVEGHLVFGLLAKGFPLGWLLAVLFTVNYVWAMATTERTFLLNFFTNLDKLFFIIVPIYLLKISKYYQAAIGWCVTKVCGGLFVFIMFFVGGVIGKLRGQLDATHIALLALIWTPGLEFIPKLVERQKSITLTRIAISIPIVYLWYKTGTWTW